MAVAVNSRTAEHTVRWVAAGETSSCTKAVDNSSVLVISGASRQGGTVVKRYQGGVVHRSAEAAAS